MSSTSLKNFQTTLRAFGSEERARNVARFFKSGEGEYGEGDLFLGVKVPEVRSTVKLLGSELSRADTLKLLHSKYHEERLAALLILVKRFQKGDQNLRKEIYETYLGNTKYINNWDLVDLSAEHIVGSYLDDRSKRPLDKLARSKLIWERRIAMIATFHYIKQSRHQEAFHIADTLLDDDHDLIHKAVGWMLREVGKKCGQPVLEEYLKPRYKKMPRTMLRYAIERFSPARRQLYLKGTV